VTAPEPLEPIHVRLPPKLRREANHRRAGPNRDAILRLADELEASGDHGLVSNATARDGLRAFGDESDRLERPSTEFPIEAWLRAAEAKAREPLGEPPRELEPIHVRLPPKLRREANHRVAGPNRDAILRLADELEATGDASLVSHVTLRDGLAAIGAGDDSAEGRRDADAAR